MADTGRFRGVFASESEHNRNSEDSYLGKNPKMGFYGYFASILLLVAISFLLFFIEAVLFYDKKNVLLLVFVLILTEFCFFSYMFNNSKGASDKGFLHDIFWAAMAPLLATFAREGFTLSAAETTGTIVYVVTSFLCAMCVFPLFAMRHELWGYTSLTGLVRTTIAVFVNVVLVTFVVFIINRHDGVARTIPMLHLLFLLVPLLSLRIVSNLTNFQGRVIANQESIGSLRTGDRSVEPEHVLLVGVNRLSEYYIHTIDTLGDGSVEVVGILANEIEHCGCQIRSVPVIGTSNETRQVLHDFESRGVSLDRIILCCPWADLPQAAQRRLIIVRSERKVRIEQIEDRIGSLIGVLGIRRMKFGAEYDLFGRTHAQADQANTDSGGNKTDGVQAAASGDVLRISPYFKFKRIFDFAIACMMIVAAAPLMIAAVVLIGTTNGFPVLFWQKRPGLNGKVFRVYKFRTMLAPFEQNGERRAESARETSIGNILRRARIDELPQLFNILRGDMSLIGPRPLLPVDQPTNAKARLMIRPGVTGWAQVNGGVDLSAEEKLALDLWYARHASLWLDVKIILMSVVMVIRGDRKNDAAVYEAMSEFVLHNSGAV